MPRVSVIIPCYNVAPWLVRCMDNVVAQTLDDIEIICIDDKSTDDTLKILRQYQRQDSRIRVIAHRTNTGVAVARNEGMAHATGEYIGFIDPDDYVDTDFYEKLYDCATETGADVTKADVISIDMNNGQTKITRTKFKSFAEFTNAFWSAIYRRDFLSKYNIDFPAGIPTSQDSVFLTRVCVHVSNIAFVHNTYYHYFYQRPGSLDSRFLSRVKAESKYRAFALNLKYIQDSQLSDRDKNAFINGHVLSHVEYELCKLFENDADRERLFGLLVDACHRHQIKKYLIRRFGALRTRCIVDDDYQAFTSYKTRRIYLFALVPFIRIESIPTRKHINLFEVMPLLKIKIN